MRFKQASVAPSIKFFKDNFFKKYDLKEYENDKEPVVFFGAQGNNDLIINHKGYKIILPTTPNDIPNINDYEKTFFICSDNYILPKNVIRKSITPEIKDYSIFKPNPLGDKIYVYTGFKNGWDLNNNLVNEIRERVDFEIITTLHNNLQDYYDINYLKSNYYDKCFINLNFTVGHGLSTVIELGLMGRKTIFKPFYSNNIQRLEFPNFIYYDTIDDIVNIIIKESEKIGTIQEPINAHNVGDEWLDLNFWL